MGRSEGGGLSEETMKREKETRWGGVEDEGPAIEKERRQVLNIAHTKLRGQENSYEEEGIVKGKKKETPKITKEKGIQ